MAEKSSALGEFSIISVGEDGKKFAAIAKGGRLFAVSDDGENLMKSEDTVDTVLFHGSDAMRGDVMKNLIAMGRPMAATEASKKSARLAYGVGLILLGLVCLLVLATPKILNVLGKPVVQTGVVRNVTPITASVEDQNAAKGPVAVASAPQAPSPAIELPTDFNVRPNIDISASGAEEPVPVGLTPVVPSTSAISTGSPQASNANPLELRSQDALTAMNDVQSSAREMINEVGVEETQKSLAAIQSVLSELNSGGKITAEMASQLPHEVADQLRKAGMIQTLEEVAAVSKDPNLKVIRLPAAVVDRYRDTDGVASIPEANSWIATGGYVRVPLPGGGDINTPEDMEAFGLKP